MVPYYVAPFDASVNIVSSADYFTAISNATLNKPVFDKINEIIAAGEIGRGCLAAEIAIDALVVDVKLTGDVFGVFVFEFSHGVM